MSSSLSTSGAPSPSCFLSGGGQAGPGRHRLLPVAPAICLELTRTKRGAACGGDAGGTASPSVRPVG